MFYYEYEIRIVIYFKLYFAILLADHLIHCYCHQVWDSSQNLQQMILYVADKGDLD